MPEAPLLAAGEPDRFPVFQTADATDLLPPEFKWPPIPKELGLLAGAPDEARLVDALAVARFAQENPQRREWENRRESAEARRIVLTRRAARLAQRESGTEAWKIIPGGTEPKLEKSRLGKLYQPALLILGLAAVASALNVAATYAIEAGAWASLIERPWTAYLFMFVAPAGGLAFVFGIESRLKTDKAKDWFGIGVAICALIAWAAWLVEFDRFYALQSLIGDAAGRRLPPNLANADSDLHGRLLLTQMLGEVLAGATFKLLGAWVERRNSIEVPVPSPLLKCIEAKYDTVSDAAVMAAGFVGRIEDFSDNYAKNLAGYTALCLAGLNQSKNANQAREQAAEATAQAAAANARAGFLTANDPLPMQHRNAGE
jgi:hypothetical protein